jgi:hypothetical protein
MKCIRCGNDSKYKERPERRCPKCRGSFAFEPKAGDKLTDTAFKSALDAVSANGSVRWGVEHLYYEVCRRVRKHSLNAGILVFVFLAALFLLSPGVGVKIVAGIVIAILSVVWLTSSFGNRDYVAIDLATFNAMWSRWNAIHGVPKGVIARQKQPPKPQTVEPDIGDYSFDRAVICDRARTVDLLLANNFHFENNCAVLSIEGYPQGPFETVRKMLKRNPKLQVFALHDASPAGCGLAHRLRTDPDWFAGGVRVVDVGLSPYQTKRFQGLFLEARYVAGTIPGISADDAKWLSRYTLELAAIRPDQVIKRLFRAINQTRGNAQKGARKDEGDLIITNGDAGGGDFSMAATDSDGSFDSFG